MDKADFVNIGLKRLLSEEEKTVLATIVRTLETEYNVNDEATFKKIVEKLQ